MPQLLDNFPLNQIVVLDDFKDNIDKGDEGWTVLNGLRYPHKSDFGNGEMIFGGVDIFGMKTGGC